MMVEQARQQRIAWIPLILAAMALLGISAISWDDSQERRRHNNFDGVGLSIGAEDFWTTGRVSDPLLFGSPSPPIDTVCLDPQSTWCKAHVDDDFAPTGFRHGVARGRAPPVEV